MKILVISHEYPPLGGGGANACLNLAREYRKRGHEVTILTAWYQGEAENEETTDGVKIYRVRARRKHLEHCGFAEMLDFVVKAIPFAGRLQKNERFDICQVFFGIPSGPIGYYLKKKYKLPYVIRFGGGDIPGFQDRFKMVYKFIGPFVKLFWKNANALVANSDGLKNLAKEFCDQYPIEIFPNGVDTDKFFPIPDETGEPSRIRILFVSRLIERKGLQFVLPFISELENKSGKKIELTIVGDGPYKSNLLEIVEANKLEKQVQFVGQKNKDELLTYYQNNDLFILPSKKEGMPNVVLEAMACGLPIVMSPCQGSKELIGANGLIADSDLTKFKETLLKAITLSETELRNMGKESRRLAEEQFSWGSVSDKYLTLFNDII